MVGYVFGGYIFSSYIFVPNIVLFLVVIFLAVIFSVVIFLVGYVFGGYIFGPNMVLFFVVIFLVVIRVIFSLPIISETLFYRKPPQLSYRRSPDFRWRHQAFMGDPKLFIGIPNCFSFQIPDIHWRP